MRRIALFGFLVGGLAACSAILDIPSEAKLVGAEGGGGAGGSAGAAGTGGTAGASGAAGKGGGTTDCTGTLRVRILADLTGATAEVSVPYYKAEMDYLRELNEKGGIRGCKIEIDDKDYAYDVNKAQQIYDAWKAAPEWPEVSAIFGFGSGDTLKLAPLVKEDKKPLISASYIGSLASPVPVDVQVKVPEVGPTFEETLFPAQLKSDGYPYNFFAGTDYSTGARIAMFHVKQQGAKRVAMFHCTAAYCTGPIPAARTYAKSLGLNLGRDLVVELTEDQATYKTKVLQYFQQELDQKKKDPSYTPVDWVWMGNTTKTTAYLGIALAEANQALGLNVKMIVNTWGFDETLFKYCGAACVENVLGIMPFVAYNDTTRGASEMAKVIELHDKWRKREADMGIAPADASHRNVRYVQGYVSAQLFQMGVERVLTAGKPVTGENLKEALETLKSVDMGGLCDRLTFTAVDHRPQSTEAVYKISAAGTLENIPPDRTISTESSWLGW